MKFLIKITIIWALITTSFSAADMAPLYTYRVINTYPHIRSAFTQGLVFADGRLYEGTGVKGRSTLRIVDLETGKIKRLRDLPARYFGEGITLFEDRIIQLTWRSNRGFVYDQESFELLREFDYPTDGWGITHDGKRLIMSDGTPTLTFLDPKTFLETGRVEVRDIGGALAGLNELEYIRGEVWANVWPTERIVRIDPADGRVTGWIDLEGLLGAEDRKRRVDVLNGIAYDAKEDRIFVTGKLWPKLFEIKLVPLE
ncbi:glutaminyl-peptide cyclotransferase [Thermodesulfobacteriota bacterium]